jgi:hypothetical protein
VLWVAPHFAKHDGFIQVVFNLGKFLNCVRCCFGVAHMTALGIYPGLQIWGCFVDLKNNFGGFDKKILIRGLYGLAIRRKNKFH